MPKNILTESALGLDESLQVQGLPDSGLVLSIDTEVVVVAHVETRQCAGSDASSHTSSTHPAASLHVKLVHDVALDWWATIVQGWLPWQCNWITSLILSHERTTRCTWGFCQNKGEISCTVTTGPCLVKQMQMYHFLQHHQSSLIRQWSLLKASFECGKI